jgi:hypothetical protein
MNNPGYSNPPEGFFRPGGNKSHLAEEVHFAIFSLDFTYFQTPQCPTPPKYTQLKYQFAY